MDIENYCERTWTKGSGGKSPLESNAKRLGLPEAGGVLQLPYAGG